MNQIWMIIASFLIVITTVSAQDVTVCNATRLRTSIPCLIDETFRFSERNEQTCTNRTLIDEVSMLERELDYCRDLFAPSIHAVTKSYVQLIDEFNSRRCALHDDTRMSCSTENSHQCLKYLYQVLTLGDLAVYCRQAPPTVVCLNSDLDECSGFPRYMLSRWVNEIQLTSSQICGSRSCRVDLALECYQDAIETIQSSVAIVPKSKILCSNIRASLACMGNHTEMCFTDDIPGVLVTAFNQLLQFATTYCPLDDTFIGQEWRDLLPAWNLGVITSSDWSDEEKICRVYKQVSVKMASDSFSMSPLSTTWLPWLRTAHVILDKFSQTCFKNQSVSCDWLERGANENPQCDIDLATQCVDMSTLSRLVLEVNVGLNTWEAVCSVGYNMLACTQYYTGFCFNQDLSAVMTLTQEVEGLLGYECSHVTVLPTNQMCQSEPRSCDLTAPISECSSIWTGVDDVCSLYNEIYECLHEQAEGCSSVSAAPLQFFMEWLLGDCTLNTTMTLLPEDSLLSVANCAMQYGYNMNNGFQIYADFQTLYCTATEAYQQCLASLDLPETITEYHQALDKLSKYQCSILTADYAQVDIQEDAGCALGFLAGQTTLLLEMFYSLPLSPLEHRHTICRAYQTSPLKQQLNVAGCSDERQALIADAVTMLDTMSGTFCSDLNACDKDKISQCLKDFGGFTLFARQDADICGKLTDTYTCLLDNSVGCDDNTHFTLLEEVKAAQSLLGNISCPSIEWCGQGNTSVWFPWQQAMCNDQSPCRMFDWVECVAEYGLYTSCFNYSVGVTCIEQSLLFCDPVQILLAKNDMLLWIQENGGQCNFVPSNEPPGLLPIHSNIYACGYNSISTTTDVTKSGICNAITSYMTCLLLLDGDTTPDVWKGVLNTNNLIWLKEHYMQCQLLDSDEFLVTPDSHQIDTNGVTCDSLSAQFCLRSYMEMVVTTLPLLTITDREAAICQRERFLRECVIRNASSCTSALELTMLSSVKWLHGILETTGTCTNHIGTVKDCDPAIALGCIAELGEMMTHTMPGKRGGIICLKLQVVSDCVNRKTSSCDFNTRVSIEETFSKVFLMVKSICTDSPTTPSTTSCVQEGQSSRCDLEDALMCIVPVQAAMLEFNTTLPNICSRIPDMKACLRQSTGSCDATTLSIVSARVNRLSMRLDDQCPEIYCDECVAQMCLFTLQKQLQYETVDYCSVVQEARQCIYDSSHHCASGVQDSLQQQVLAVAGTNALICDVSLPVCLENFVRAAMMITSYQPTYTDASSYSQNYELFSQQCMEASSNYYCLVNQLANMDNKTRMSTMNSTLLTMAALLTHKCQGPNLECHSCVNATSNQDCNRQQTQICSQDMQMCGTYVRAGTLSKGCVNPSTCQTGCTQDSCSLCCDSHLCNQPLNDVIREPDECRLQVALLCSYRLMVTIVQNGSLDCSSVEESAICIIEASHHCVSPEAQSLTTMAQGILSGDHMASCTGRTSVCACGECYASMLLGILSSASSNIDEYCRSVYSLYNQTVQEIDLTSCDLMGLQDTVSILNMATYMTQGLCSQVHNETDYCVHNGQIYPEGASFPAGDGCNSCSCGNGNVICTLTYCPPTEGHCNFNNQLYTNGESFMSTDGCNQCFCSGGQVSCTLMYCPPPETNCDMADIQMCLTNVDLQYQMTMATNDTAKQQVCMSAVAVMECVIDKLNLCSADDVQTIQQSTLWILSSLTPHCDMNKIMWTYIRIGWSGRWTQDAFSGGCSLGDLNRCFQNVSEDINCGSAQHLVDCVSTSMTSCVSVDMVPIIYDIKYVLESTYSCDIELPWRLRSDPLLPIATCLQTFAHTLRIGVTQYLQRDEMSHLCQQTSHLLWCLGNITSSDMIISTVAIQMRQTLTDLLQRCGVWHQINPADILQCQSCHSASDLTSCNILPSVTCSPGQVCSVNLHMDSYNGIPVWTKGCTSPQMCTQDCDPLSMTCTMCCYESLCNSDLNITSPVVSTTSPVTPLTKTTPHQVACNLEEVSSSLASHVLRLISFYSTPVVNQLLICQNYKDHIQGLIGTLDQRCSAEIRDQVQKVGTWLLAWSDDTCNNIVDTGHCLEAVTCVQNIQTFESQQDACGNVSASMRCLKSYVQLCNSHGQHALNKTTSILSSIYHTICDENRLSGEDDPVCIDITMKKVPMATCNETETDICISAMQNAMINQFIPHSEFCNMMKRGMYCIQRSTFNCSSDFYESKYNLVMDIVKTARNLCPESLCPLSDKCRLLTGVECVVDMETRMFATLQSGNWSGDVCRSLEKTHICVLNTTIGCQEEDVNTLTHHFATLALYVAPFCNAFANRSEEQCLESYSYTAQALSHIKENYVEELLLTAVLRTSLAKRISMLINDELITTEVSGNFIWAVINSSNTGILAYKVLMKQMGLYLDTDMSSEMTRCVLYYSEGKLGHGEDSTNCIDRFGLTLLGVVFGLSQQSLTGINLPGFTGINLPGYMGINLPGYMGINLPGFTGLNLPGYMMVYEGLNLPGSFGTVNPGYGLGLPGGYSTGGTDENFSQELKTLTSYGNTNLYGIALPGGLLDDDADPDDIPGFSVIENILRNVFDNFMYQKILNNTDLNLDNIEMLLTEFYGKDTVELLLNEILNSDNENSEVERHIKYKNTLQQYLRKTIYMVENSIGPSAGVWYEEMKLRLCSEFTETFRCLKNRVTQRSLSGVVASDALQISFVLNSGVCEGVVCHKCVSVHSDNECNLQPTETCGRAQMCQSKIENGMISKGCSAIVTCEEECARSNGVCRCCHGYQCNALPIKDFKAGQNCDSDQATQEALEVAISILNSSHTFSIADMQTNLESIVQSTKLCPENGREFVAYIQASRLLQFLEAESCRQEDNSNMCNLDSLVTLTSVIASPFTTVKMTNSACSLLQKAVEDFATTFKHSGMCCSSDVYRMLVDMSKHTVPYCAASTIKPLCNPLLLISCTDTRSNSSVGNVDSVQLQDNEANAFCRYLENVTSWSDTAMFPRCQITDAWGHCLNGLPLRSNNCSLYDDVQECMASFLQDCGGMQAQVVHNELMATFPQCVNTRNDMDTCLGSSLQYDMFLNGTLSTMCEWLNNQTACTDNIIRGENQLLHVLRMEQVSWKLTKLSKEFCTKGNIHHAAGIYPEKCEEDNIEREVTKHMRLYLYFDLMSWKELDNICLYNNRSLDLIEEMKKCNDDSADILSLLNWLQSEVSVMCSNSVSGHTCEREMCDVKRTTALLQDLGYFLGTASFGNIVFCRKLETTLDKLDCMTSNCTSKDMQPLEGNMQYIRSIVQDRCPKAIEKCDARFTLDLNSQPPNYSDIQKDSTCNLVAAELCILENALPQITDPFYCSKTITVTHTMSKCAMPYINSCNEQSKQSIHTLFATMTSYAGIYCIKNFTEEFVLGHSMGQCFMPMCSYNEATSCILTFKSIDNSACRHYDEAAQCVQYATRGCNEIQKQGRVSHLLIVASEQDIPLSCMASGFGANSSTSLISLIGCIKAFTNQIRRVIEEGYNATLCDIGMTMLSCLETELSFESTPGAMRRSLMHLVRVVKPSLTFSCQETEPKSFMNESNDSDCDVGHALSCLESHTVTPLLSAALTQEGKEYVCNNRFDGRECVSVSLENCRSSGQRAQLLNAAVEMIEIMGQLSGTCTPTPFTCEPTLAAECIGELAERISNRVPDMLNDIGLCSAVYDTSACVRETTARCNTFSRQNILQMYEPLRCQASALCPSSIENPELKREPIPCFSPSVADQQDDMPSAIVCDPKTAIRCIQDVYGAYTDMLNVDTKSVCLSYADALSCFFRNIRACESDVVLKMAMYNLLMVEQTFNTICRTQIKPSCEIKSKVIGCDSGNINACFNQLASAENSSICLSRRKASDCLEKHAYGCSNITRTYLKARMQKYVEDSHSDEIHCNSLHQCLKDYVEMFANLTHMFRYKLQEMYNSDAKIRQPDNYRLLENEIIMSNGYEKDKFTFVCQDKIFRSECIRSNLDTLPNDVAAIMKSAISEFDDRFTDICSVFYGIRSWFPECNATCIEQCFAKDSQLQNLLPALESFNNVDNSSSPATFCRFYEEIRHVKPTVIDLETNIDVCVNDKSLLRGVHQLYLNYCTLPCDISIAEACVAAFSNAMRQGMSKDDMCRIYFETQTCIEDNARLCESNSTVQLIKQVENQLSVRNLRCYKLPDFEIVPERLSMLEGEIVEIGVNLRSEISDHCYTDDCKVVLKMTMNGANSCPVSSKTGNMCCPVTHTKSVFMASRCSSVISDGDSDAGRMVHVTSRLDYKINTASNVSISFGAELFDGGISEISATIATFTMTVVDRDTAGVCSIVQGPLITTFDGLKYYNINQGEFVLYRDSYESEEVHLGVQRCGNMDPSVCVCAVMVKVSDDVLVLDNCRRKGNALNELDFRVFKNDMMSEDLRVYSTHQKDLFQFVLPSNAIVNVQAALQQQSSLTVWVKPSALNSNKTLGLCGDFDGNKDNDLQYTPDGTGTPSMTTWRGRTVANEFVKTWRAKETLLVGIPTSNHRLFDSYFNMANEFCNGSSGLPVDRAELCHIVSGSEITDQLGLYLQTRNINRRKKRDAHDPWSEIDYDAGPVNDTLPTWPNGSGITEIDAIRICDDFLKTSVLSEMCRNIINMNDIIETCVVNILLTDSTRLLPSAMAEMKLECKYAVLAEPTRASMANNMTTDDLLNLVLSSSCVNDCSGQGQCVDGLCQCYSDFFGENCALAVGKPPVVSSLSEDVYLFSQATAYPVTRNVTVFGQAFFNSASLTCHHEELQPTEEGFNNSGTYRTSKALFLTQNSMICTLTGTPPFTGYRLSVSNNGVNQSSALHYIMHDPICYDCITNVETCNKQPTSCLLDGECYAAGAYNPSDPCYLCDPITNTWQFKSSSSCTHSTTTLKPSTTLEATSTLEPTTKSVEKTSSGQATETTGTTPQATTVPENTGNKDEQNASEKAEEEQTTLTIVIAVGASVGVVIIIAVVCFSIRRKKPNHVKEPANPVVPETMNQDRQEQQGQGIFSAAAPINGAGASTTRAAPFNPANLGGQTSAPDVYHADEGIYRVNMSMFDAQQESGNTTEPTADGNQREITGGDGNDESLIVSRPELERVPAEVHGYDNVSYEPDIIDENAARRIHRDDYDNARPLDIEESGRASPIPDYDSSSSIMRL